MNCSKIKIVLSLVLGTCFSGSLAHSQHPLEQPAPAQTAHNHIADDAYIGQNAIENFHIDSAPLPYEQRARFFYRTLPVGDLHQRFPYESLRFYYYNRPYNSFNTSGSQQLQVLGGGPSNHLFSREVFRQVYQNAEQQIIDSRFLDYAESAEALGSPIESPVEQVARDKNFEFVDWREHYHARLESERQQAALELEREQAAKELAIQEAAKERERQQAALAHELERHKATLEFERQQQAAFELERRQAAVELERWQAEKELERQQAANDLPPIESPIKKSPIESSRRSR